MCEYREYREYSFFFLKKRVEIDKSREGEGEVFKKSKKKITGQREEEG